MPFIALGCLAFVLLYLFDLSKLRTSRASWGILFFTGCAILMISSIAVFFSPDVRFGLPPILKGICLFCALASALGMVWALFFALPFSKTYVSGTGDSVVDTGLYALCRHPGVIFFSLMYFFLWLASGTDMMLWAAVAWTVMDIIHVYVQDVWFFPKLLSGYDEYRQSVPFLIPNTKSIKHCIDTFSDKGGG